MCTMEGGHDCEESCNTQRLKPRRIPTATRTASSPSRRPQLAILRASSQSPLCAAKDAKNLAFCDGYTKEFSTNARSAWNPGLSQKDCLPGNGSGGGPAEVDQDDRYESRNESVGRGNCTSICSWRTRVLAAEAKKEKGRSCERGHLSYPQATMFDWHWLQPLSVIIIIIIMSGAATLSTDCKRRTR